MERSGLGRVELLVCISENTLLNRIKIARMQLDGLYAKSAKGLKFVDISLTFTKEQIARIADAEFQKESSSYKFQRGMSLELPYGALTLGLSPEELIIYHKTPSRILDLKSWRGTRVKGCMKEFVNRFSRILMQNSILSYLLHRRNIYKPGIS